MLESDCPTCVLDFTQKRKKDIVCVKRKSNDDNKKNFLTAALDQCFFFPAFINMKNAEDIRF